MAVIDINDVYELDSTGANVDATAKIPFGSPDLTAEQQTQARGNIGAVSQNDYDVLDARVDQIASLPAGSTSGDAELMDIRVGYDGYTWPTAGDAVRGQAADLKSDLNDLDDWLGYPENLFDGSEWVATDTSNWGFEYTNNSITYTHKTQWGGTIPSWTLDFEPGQYIISGSTDVSNLFGLYINGTYSRNIESGYVLTVESGKTYALTLLSISQGTSRTISNISVISKETDGKIPDIEDDIEALTTDVTALKNDIAFTATGTVDFNSFTTSIKKYINSTQLASASNRPPLTGSFCLLVVNVSDTGVVMQTAIYSQVGSIYTRRRNAAGTSWSDWVATSESIANVQQGTINFNNYTVPGSFYIGSTEVGTASNAPTNDTESYCIVRVEVATNSVVTQTAVFPMTGAQYIRRRNAAGTSWSNWVGGTDYLGILFAFPVLSKLTFQNKQKRVCIQDIAVYNGNIFDLDSGYVSVNGGAKFAITNGHGNNAMFGTELHGDYPYLYCGSWTKDDCKVYVNQMTSNSATLVRTIDFNTLSGYLNMAVDEENGKIYILLCTSETTDGGDVDFIVANLSDGSIVSRKTLNFKIPIIQGMQFSTGLIYVVYGNIASNVQNTIIALTTDGDISSKSCAINVSEIEGIAIDGSTLYVADNVSIYY